MRILIMPSDREIVEGIAAHNSFVLQYIYDELYPYVESYIVQNGGSNDLAQDIFQEGMIIVYRKIEAGKFTLFCKFSTYLYAVCKKLWIQERKKNAFRRNKIEQIPQAAEPEIEYGDYSINQAREIFEKHFKSLSHDCQIILKLYFNDVSSEEIRDLLNYKSTHHVSDKKFRCKKKLISAIKNDPLFKKLRRDKK